MTRMMLGVHLVTLGFCSALVLSTSGCAEETATGEQRVHIVRNNEAPAEVGGIPPDKQADIQLMLQQREPSVRKCYNDVLNDGSHDRKRPKEAAGLVHGKAGDPRGRYAGPVGDEIL